MSNRQRRNRQSGFTLMELMIVLVIIGILAAAVAPVLINRTDKARVITAKGNLKTICDQLKMFRADNSRYPDTLEDLVNKPSYSKEWPEGGYLEKVPKDPWGGEYVYRRPGESGKDFDLIALGADNQTGGESFDADINYWTMDEDSSKK